MFQKILVANRGEIACRVIRTCHRLGIATVAVYSDADRNSLHVSEADEAVHIGAAPARESYLRGDRILEACRRTGAQAVHPGYGFLSENAEFAEACEAAGVVFIGPTASAIRAMGSKSAAKQIMEHAGVPLVPGYHGDEPTPERLRAAAEQMGYPVLLKAIAGGGGKGMRVVERSDDFDEALASAQREAASSFGNEAMLVEKYLQRPRHVEVQVFCDCHGNGVYLFERDCSVQRRHQKVIEEAPAPGISEELRTEMCKAAVRAAQAIDYRGAGTIEFLLDSDGSYYFMEMNTRLQVEHPVTEMITGQDLVEWQLRVAAGEPLPLQQQELQINGHAFEARIYAEDPAKDFMPATGRLEFLHAPEASTGGSVRIRVDTGVRQGDEVSVFYDPMIAKLIAWGASRAEALQHLSRALAQYAICGPATNVAFLRQLAEHPAFAAGELDTGFIARHRASLLPDFNPALLDDLPLASLYLLLRMEQEGALRRRPNDHDPHSPWQAATAWRLNHPAAHAGAIIVNGEAYEVPVVELPGGPPRRFQITARDKTVEASGRLDGAILHADIDGHRRSVIVGPHNEGFTLFSERGALTFALARSEFDDNDEDDRNPFLAPMNGVIIKLLVEPGVKVTQDQALLIMEAMKMEYTIRAPADGQVSEFYFQVGDQVRGGESLLEFAEKV